MNGVNVKLTVVGTGYVGLVTGTCFADLGNHVICVDKDKSKIDTLTKGHIPIYEPGLQELVAKSRSKGRLEFTTDMKKAVTNSEVIFICVGTPPREDGSADLSNIANVSREVAKHMNSYKLIVEKSTVPVETGEWVKRTIKTFASKNKKEGVEFDIASNPEFLREGSAISDFMNPDRIVLGVENKKAHKILKKLYESFDAPILVTDIKGAEIIKHASNSFLATKISFINAVANVCEKVGTDVEEVARGIGLDRRINMHFLKAGPGFGGFCFPKDLKAFIHIAESLGCKIDLLKEVEKINEDQKNVVLKKIKSLVKNIKGKTITVLGLSFKPNTDDIRVSPSIFLVKKLLSKNANIKVYDPRAMGKAKSELKNRVQYAKDVYEAAKSSDCLLIMTEWDEFKKMNLSKIKKTMRNPNVMDARNIYNPEDMKRLGFSYRAIGRRV